MARPLGFDPGNARQALKRAFWAKGYDGTSMQDIEAETGLNKQSLYRLFGDKRGMYRAALRDYEACEMAAAERLLARPGTARERIEGLFRAVVVAAVAGDDPNGCFLSAATAGSDPGDAETRALLKEMADRLLAALRGALPDDLPPERAEAMARHFQAVYLGLRLLLKGGVPAAAAEQIVAEALAEL
ncbi:TetR/AcrR family transcriptional regulator [Shinella sp. DD12]|jgi:TetR/AcrR family transcriptional regulator, transcriptional repressor for nem operon|uniref:TetR/AcrR family transcriptional regulator n=1 Tax=Shinella sp. DD12 TaxID=1410620 RepID=UPI000437B174|nr:TetR/AcrR family transcriptional regulator [Shinella sp. DD12]EYR77942.1 transcriptional regulator TetR family [Shinella sp. DD12]MCA0343163.1 TetR/AcrR family transcriptional regulator [Pseudomonadota bacterium]